MSDLTTHTRNARLLYAARFVLCSCIVLMLSAADRADDTDPSLLANRAAIERVYYNHRLGEKPPFDQMFPRAALRRLVQLDQTKEDTLRRVYSVDITKAALDAEVQHINTMTRAPEVLAEIKAALGNDPQLFANAVAKPVLVERLLREKFDNDDALHASQRKQVEQTRNSLLTARKSNADYSTLLALLKRNRPEAVIETVWQFGVRPTAPSRLSGAEELEIQKRFGPNAQILSSPQRARDEKFYFQELPAELQNVLRVQLRGTGDISAVIEMPGSFLLYVAKQQTQSALSAAVLSLPKRSYEQWLDKQGSDD